MVHEAVAQRYAAALFQLAMEQGQAQKVHDELRAIEKELRQHPTLARALHAPNVPDKVKKDICRKLFGSHNPWLLNFLFLLVDKKREDYVPEILRQYRQLLDTASGVVKADVETAVDLSTVVKQQFTEMLSRREGKVVQITWHVNPDLIGGYVVRIGDRLYDASLRAQLSGLQRKLENV